jgi:hypothetical protein
LKQNVLSRLTETEIKIWLAWVNDRLCRVEAESEGAAKKMIREQMGLAKLPRGTKVIEEVPEVVKEDPEQFAMSV